MLAPLLPERIELEEFKPGVEFIPGLNLLVYLAEDTSFVTVPVHQKVYHYWDLYRASYGAGYIGFQFWLWYDPNLLLPAPK